MFAVVETGGKQYKATPGGFIEVEKLPGEKGEQITLDRVLLVADGESVTVGQPSSRVQRLSRPSLCRHDAARCCTSITYQRSASATRPAIVSRSPGCASRRSKASRNHSLAPALAEGD